ncbi:condensation domain-containing protein [Nonomuraea diastatica]|uniref:Condensation domain-containing protein n=1 Tax=Nonomuraea diastatica TaxID=1848329 RepID=A0A4R4W7Q1_9ACTN|nr:condensation domain-containing protein [Nonomuraea diastatica]TDD14061.1 hypothetical protein E1294_38740 [Nonomuraea diastatica]
MTTGSLAALLAAERAVSPPRTARALWELTWGQRGIYEHFRRNGFAMSAAAVTVLWRLPQPCEPAVVQAALDHLVERHECLRTVYFDVSGAPLDPSNPAPTGRVRQQVEPADTVPAHVVTCGPDEVEDYAAHLLRMADEEFSFDPQDVSAMRVVMIATGDGVVAVAGVISHMAVDSFGVTTLAQEFDHCVRRALAGRPFDGLPPARQPRELVADETTVTAARANADTIRYFRSVLRDAPARFVSSGRSRSQLRASKVKGKSWTLQRSVDEIARRSSTAAPTVLSALLTAQLAELTGESRVLLRTLHARRHWFSGVSYVAPHSLPSLMLLDVPPRFEDLLAAARAAATTASSRADFDVCALNDLHAEKARAIGAALDGFILFNCWDMHVPAADADIPPRPTEVEVWPQAGILLDMQGEAAFWSQLEPGAIWVNFSCNEDLVGVDARTFLHHLEQFAASVADAPSSRLS